MNSPITNPIKEIKRAQLKSEKLPALHFYPGDWWKDAGVQSLDHFHKGIWFEMLLLMFDSHERGVLLLNGKQMSSKSLSKLLAVDEVLLEAAIKLLLETGVCYQREDGALFNKRMVEDENKYQIKRSAGQQGGLAKALANSKQTSSKRPSKRVANADSEDEIEDEIEDLKIGEVKILNFLIFDEISIDTWKAKLTPTGFDRACDKLNGWIGQSKGTPEFQDRRAIGKNASFAIQNWVAVSVGNEKTNGSGKNGFHKQDPPARVVPKGLPAWISEPCGDPNSSESLEAKRRIREIFK